MMKRKNWLVVLIIILLFGIASTVFAQSRGGTFTLTNLPSRFDGKFAILLGDDADNSFEWFGGERIITWEELNVVASRISDGQVILPMWIIRADGRMERYSGNHGNVDVDIVIYDFATINENNLENYIGEVEFQRVNFSNGSARRAWNEGRR